MSMKHINLLNKNMERKEIIKRVKKILSKHEENTSEGAIYWNFEWVGGKEIPTGRGGYIQEGGERVYSDKAFYEEMADFISEELDKAKIEVLTEIFQTCYQEDSKTLELVEEKLSKLKGEK